MPSNIEQLNADCTCITLDLAKLSQTLTDVVGDAEFGQRLGRTHSHLIARLPLFLTADHAGEMMRVIEAVEHVATMPAYRNAVLGLAPPIASSMMGPVGVFMGYDFHLGPNGPRLIEINTNAGGALINAYVREAQLLCCGDLPLPPPGGMPLEATLDAFTESFRSEWRRQRDGVAPRSIAIVDDAPESQFLYPEFVLFKLLFERRGMPAVITDPSRLTHQGGALLHEGKTIDLVYNRLTDFELAQPASAPLRSAYLAGDVVVTPNPWAHAHFADKRNLTLLSDETLLRTWGVAPDIVATLANGIPRTVLVTPRNASELWTNRNDLFFKPCAGYGSKAAYRGDKVTRKVWAQILASSYVAQRIVPASSRSILIDGHNESLKADLRCYTYDGRLLLTAARLYQGQTTNFRTPGGGFAPVFMGAGEASCAC